MQKKIVIGIVGSIVVLLLVLGIFICIQYYKMKPTYSGSFEIPGLENMVSINWDSSGVIHILGKSTRDVIFASGFAVAKERIWQMEMTRRVAKGRLSEVFGDTTLQIDKLFLTLGIDSLTEKIYRQLSSESQQWLIAYAQGVNAYLDANKDDLPIEFLLLKVKPEPWTPQDCLLQNRLMAWFLNFNWRTDLLYWRLYSILPRNKFSDIWPKWEEGYPTILQMSEMTTLMQELDRIDRQARKMVGMPLAQWGSNNWVVAPAKTAKGFSILANDPHLALQLPSVWIELHLQSEDLNVAGFAFPGTPGIIIGRNDHIAWGVTNGMIDDSDYFIEEVDTVKQVYVSDGHEKALDVRVRTIKVKDKGEYYFSVFRTQNGPLFDKIFPTISAKKSLSFRWVGFENSDEMQTFIRLNRAENWADFEEALRFFTLPCQNFVYADKQGNIGYRLGGKIPLRSYKHGLLPVEGKYSKNAWTSWIPFHQMPHISNPSKSYICTANNQIAAEFPHYLSELWEPPYRAQRIVELLEANAEIERNYVQMIQMDVLNGLAKEILPILLTDLKKNIPAIPKVEEILLLLSTWDFKMEHEKIAPTIFEVWQYQLIKNIFLDEMGDEVFKFFTELPNFYQRIFVQVLKNRNSTWFDNIHTNQRENRSEIITSSFEETIQYLMENSGTDIEDWTWGRFHQLELKHPLGEVAITRAVFNKGPFSVDGNGTTVQVMSYQYSRPFEVVVGASMRMVVDWSEPDYYWSVIAGRNSGHFLSPYYGNQIENWISGYLKKVSIRGMKGAQIILHPAN